VTSAHTFDRGEGPIDLWVEVKGPVAESRARFLLDTGTTQTVVDAELAEWIGLELHEPDPETAIMTAGGIAAGFDARLDSLHALGRERLDFDVVVLDMSTVVGIDGLLGLDFLRGAKLTIDFVAGEITLDEPPKRKSKRSGERNP
jgi:clan AA aspartic protease (TIGR02281 family)